MYLFCEINLASATDIFIKMNLTVGISSKLPNKILQVELTLGINLIVTQNSQRLQR